MTWPTQTVSDEHIQDSGRDPDQWRAELEARLVPNHNNMVQARGAQNGVAPLDENALVPASSLNVVPVERGGTAATTAAGARTALGLGTSATQNLQVPNGVPQLDPNGDIQQLFRDWNADPGIQKRHVNYSPFWIPDEIAANSVSRTSLKTTSGNFSFSPNQGSSQNIVLPGGSWGFYPTIDAAPGGNTFSAQMVYSSTGGGNVARLGVFADVNPVPGQIVAQGSQRYLLASPPHNLGDGEFEDCLFLHSVDGQWVASYFAVDPPWYNNGWPERRGKRIPTLEELRDPAVRMQWLEDDAAGKIECEAEGYELKNWDMDKIPHPFDYAGVSVMVDPWGDEIGELKRLMGGGIDPLALIADGQLSIDNEPLKRCGPPGVPVVRARWKRTQ